MKRKTQKIDCQFMHNFMLAAIQSEEVIRKIQEWNIGFAV